MFGYSAEICVNVRLDTDFNKLSSISILGAKLKLAFNTIPSRAPCMYALFCGISLKATTATVYISMWVVIIHYWLPLRSIPQVTICRLQGSNQEKKN